MVKVKNNQPALLKQMKQRKKSQKALSQHIQEEINRGRLETRTTKTYRAGPLIESQWPGAKTIVYVKRHRQDQNEEAITESYYLSSLALKASDFALGIRHHWGIENRLHYVKDVTLLEDKSKIRSGQAPGIFSLFRNLALNIVRMKGENRIRRFFRRCAGNIELINSFLE